MICKNCPNVLSYTQIYMVTNTNCYTYKTKYNEVKQKEKMWLNITPNYAVQKRALKGLSPFLQNKNQGV